MVYAILADGEFDQVCETKEQANKEKSDLRKMGCEVKIKPFATWQEAEAYEDKLRLR